MFFLVPMSSMTSCHSGTCSLYDLRKERRNAWVVFSISRRFFETMAQILIRFYTGFHTDRYRVNLILIFTGQLLKNTAVGLCTAEFGMQISAVRSPNVFTCLTL